jgi:hypothetical protein
MACPQRPQTARILAAPLRHSERSEESLWQPVKQSSQYRRVSYRGMPQAPGVGASESV